MDRTYNKLPPDAWAAVRADYVAGATAAECAHRHHVSKSAVYARAAEDGWAAAREAAKPVFLTEADDLAVTVDLPALAARALARSALAFERNNHAEAARLLRLHRDYRALIDTDADRARRDRARDLDDLCRNVNATEQAVEALVTRLEDTLPPASLESLEPISAAPKPMSRLKASMMEAAINKAHRRGDLSALKRHQAALQAYLSPSEPP